MHNAVIEVGQVETKAVDWVEFKSDGKLLILGSADDIAAVASHCESLKLYALSADHTRIKSETQLIQLKGEINNLSGWMGAFELQAGGVNYTFDLILDLNNEPVISRQVLPLGYFAPRDNQQALAEALQQLPDLVGEFDKPRFFNYKASICAHSQRGIQACTQCLEACPAEAISSAGERVQVNPSLCQGCGSCVAVCPSGAMTYALPTLDLSLERLRSMLNRYFELETAAPHLVIHDEQQGQLLVDAMSEQFGRNVITFSIEEIGALSMPFWLAAIAYGVGHISVWDAGSHADHDWAELQQQITMSNEMLVAIGFSPLISWYAGKKIDALTQQAKSQSMPNLAEKAQFAGIDDKRRVITMALSHLHQFAPAPVDELTLGFEAAFGQVQVNTQGCTLCMSCVSVCPVGALVDGVDKPQLNFIEDLCVQCGMCETACPENVISLQPRYLFARDVARQKRLLHEEPVFNCISCQKPFATQKMIDTITAKLKDHHMFQNGALEQLKMCEDCRVKAMFKKG